MERNGKEVNAHFIENENNRSNENSRYPSNESINNNGNIPLGNRLDREITPQTNNASRTHDKSRSQSLFNIAKFHKTISMIDDNHLNGIEESPREKSYRRGSLPLEQSNTSSTITMKDAFGPQLSDDSHMNLPGTPLPSLVQENEEIPDSSVPVTPVEREQENLIKEGLELELEHKDLSFDGKTWFLKIHLPWKTKTRYAALMGMKLPIKRFITISVKAWDDKKESNKVETMYSKWQKRWKEFFEFNHDLINKEPSFYDATEGGDREEQFVVKDRVTEYSSAQRSLIVMQILLRVKFDDTDKVGIRRLLNDYTYYACFPLHEGRWNKDTSDGKILDRRLLYLEWARPAKWMKRQPLNLVRKYFGDKIGLYFCWLGYYTKMLYAPAVVGTICFLYGIFTIDSNDNIATKEICDRNGPGNITLCPMCDKACDYQKLFESCKFARLTYLFDNPATVFFAIFMSLWATVFLEMWRRKQSVIQWEWDLQATDQDEEPRPVLQYGFVTLFVAAFPLAPLCALLNNIAEIRLDAYKMVTQARRPLAERVEDIGAWYGILRAITYAAVVSNVIFNTSDYREDMRADIPNPPDLCQYRGNNLVINEKTMIYNNNLLLGYRNAPNETDPYGLSPQYWHVFAGRLAFVVVFELKTQIQRETLLAKEAKYEHGLKKSDYDYEELMQTFRDNNNTSRGENRAGMRGSWARRLSRLSDGLDAHVEVTSRKRNSVENTVWEASY
ncbi:unnamed protein product [Diabrotica balteata]|uniref:Anoctamin n=1 Tax=Diabrotica balteata TaxID=107213 RepID=A0A9N9XA39_DIABA|nr:unnamed protein product [Diabrotica balteata]